MLHLLLLQLSICLALRDPARRSEGAPFTAAVRSAAFSAAMLKVVGERT